MIFIPGLAARASSMRRNSTGCAQAPCVSGPVQVTLKAEVAREKKSTGGYDGFIPQ